MAIKITTDYIFWISKVRMMSINADDASVRMGVVFARFILNKGIIRANSVSKMLKKWHQTPDDAEVGFDLESIEEELTLSQ
eukprot:10351531-Ditylum_brightwellii.AAC.1